MVLTGEDIVVLPDLHGHAEHLKRTVDKYGLNVIYVPIGDIFNKGQQPRETMQTLRDVNTQVVQGNLEFVTNAAMNESRASVRDMWATNEWGKPVYSDEPLAAYGIDVTWRTAQEAMSLKLAMKAAGHLALFETAPLYLETDSLVAVHAGVTRGDWQEQKEYLDKVYAKSQAPVFHYEDMPPQVLSSDLAKLPIVPKGLNKTVVTGHRHLSISAEDRKVETPYGNRVFLASYLDQGEPLFVYESWSGDVVEIQA